MSDGGRQATTREALDHCGHMRAQGADMLDIGGESSRPGIDPVPLDEELGRLLPVLREAELRVAGRRARHADHHPLRA